MGTWAGIGGWRQEDRSKSIQPDSGPCEARLEFKDVIEAKYLRSLVLPFNQSELIRPHPAPPS